MSTDKVKTKYITAFYSVFLGKLKRIEERLATGEPHYNDEEELKRLKKLITKLEAQDEGIDVGAYSDDASLARDLLKQSDKLRNQAYALDPTLDPKHNQLKVA